MKKTVVCFIVLCLFFALQNAMAARLSDEDLSKKIEGWYPTGLPLVNYDSDNGFGYGVRVYLYNNGTRDDEYFAMHHIRCSSTDSFTKQPMGISTTK